MKKALFYLFIAFLLFSFQGNAQVIFGSPTLDSSYIRLADSSMYPASMISDTAASPLWRLGRTHKYFFATDSSGVRGIMTDTSHPYPINANNSIILKINSHFEEEIITFWHHYETDSMHAGGIVEYSLDSGHTWENIKGECNTDGEGWPEYGGLLTSNFYSSTDTLLTGERCFTGKNNSICSRFQFVEPPPVRISKITSGCEFNYNSQLFIRFRFKSDSTIDTLAGWMIDSFKFELCYYPGIVKTINQLPFTYPNPNPSSNGHFIFPEIENEIDYRIMIYNTMGLKIVNVAYCHLLDLSQYPKGLYFYTVSNGTDTYSGRLLRE